MICKICKEIVAKKVILQKALLVVFLLNDNQSKKSINHGNISRKSKSSPIYTEHASVFQQQRHGDDRREQQRQVDHQADNWNNRNDFNSDHHRRQADHMENRRAERLVVDNVSSTSQSPGLNLDKASLLHELKQLQMLNPGTTIITREFSIHDSYESLQLALYQARQSVEMSSGVGTMKDFLKKGCTGVQLG